MKKFRAALVANLAWTLTTVWVALIVIRALAITHGSAPAAVAMLSGPNLIGAATGAAGSLLITVMTWIAVPALLAGAFAVRLGWSRSTRWGLLTIGGISLSALVLAAPMLYLIVTIALGVIAIALGLALLRRLRSWSGKSPGADSGPIAFGFTLANYIFLLALLAISGGSWIQTEIVSTTGDARLAYFVSQDADWTTFLDYEDRELWLVRTSEIDQRTFCDVYEKDFLPYWLSVSLSGIGDARLPDCGTLD
ncbi:MAG: hypothetical protein ABIR65_10240 [Pseudolysinimonas sp.]